MARERSEYRCPCCGLVNIDEQVVEIDNKLIERVGFKPDLTSACRCKKHDEKVQNINKEKGLKTTIYSSHLCEDPKEKGEQAEKCEALDYATTTSWARAVILKTLFELEIQRIGIGKDFIHWDIDKNKPFPVCWVY